MSRTLSKPSLAATFIMVLSSLNSLHAQTEVEVDGDLLLWKKGFEYRTRADAEISLTNTSIEVDLPERKAEGSQNRSFHYSGTLLYSTNLERASSYNGSASRHYMNCSMIKSETDPLTLKVDAGFWEVWASRMIDLVRMNSLPEKWRPHMEVIERNAGENFIIVRQKADSPSLLEGGALELGFQAMGELTGKRFLLEWTRMASVGKAKVAVVPAELRRAGPDGQEGLVKVGGGVSPIVKDVIGRESKLLYEAMLGSVESRQNGDIWMVDGETLDAMVHPAVEGHFRGRAVVKAESVINESPERTVGAMNGLRLKFVRSGIVDGRSIGTDLAMEIKTVDGGKHQTKLVPEDGVFSGEIWLDTDNQTVRYGQLIVDRAKYDGYLPKFGDLNAKIELEADLSFKLRYVQSITPAEGQTVGE
jgi:hypothetical protein